MITNKLSTKLLTLIIKEENLASHGITSTLLPIDYQHNLDNWIKLGFNAEMSWIAQNTANRTQTTRVFPWAKSILIVADNYYLDVTRNNLAPKISRYAWGSDYHNIVKQKLQTVLKKMQQINPDIKGKIYVDNGPILEKAYAIEAGLGWQGKNTTIIIPEFGSFCFLGVIILNIELPKNTKKAKNLCGSCTECITKCPTGAITPNGMLDARKCISYFSIEKKHSFTDQEGKWLNDWLYGCDICQEVCPYNKKWANTGSDINYYNRLHLLEKSPGEWKDLTEYQFGELFHNSVFKRLKFDRFRRNLLTVLNNLNIK